MIGYDQIRVKCPYPLLHIHELQIDWQPGEHAKLLLTGWMDEQLQMEMPLTASVQDEIEVFYNTPIWMGIGIEQPLFRGVVNKVEAYRQNSVHKISIEGISATSLWDVKKRKRTFPEPTQTYEQLLTKVIEDYPGSEVEFHTGADKPIGDATLQYEETDWELSKRLASTLQAVVVCDMLKSVKPHFHFGLPEGKEVTVPDHTPYTAHKDLAAYQRAVATGAELHDTDFFRYELQYNEPLAIGDRVRFRDKQLVVKELHAQMEKGELLFNYVLARESGVRHPIILNQKAIGVALEGTVLDVRGEEVKLKLDVDRDDGKADPHWYPFAPPTGSPMYSMPQVGTKASLYHPDGSGLHAQVLGSVRTNGATAAKTRDPNTRYYGSEHGSELKIAPDHAHFYGNPDGTLSISLQDGDGVVIRSPKKLTITGKEDIILKSKKKVILNATEMIMAYKTGVSSGIAVEGEYHLLGQNVWADGSDRTAYAAYDDAPQEGTPPPPPDPPKPFDWGKLGRNVLGGLAIVVGVAALAAFTVATLGAGPLIVGAVAVGAVAAGGIAVGMQAASDIARGEVSDFGEYATTALRESFIGAVTGAIFGPLGAGGAIASKMALGAAENAISDVASQMLQGKSLSEVDWKSVGLSAGLGAATVGVVNSKAGKAVGEMIGNGVTKVTPQAIQDGFKAAGEGFSKAVNQLGESGSRLGQKISNGLGSPQLATANGMHMDMGSGNVNRMESRSIPETDVQRNYNKAMKEAEEKVRLIPGEPGKVTGGSSQKLGKNMFEEMGLPRSTKRTPYQAQHLIPAEYKKHPVLQKIGMDMDHASNGFFLRIPDESISPTSRHQGYHSVYSDFVEKKLDKLDINQSVDVLEKQVYDLQQKLRKLQEKGLPLYLKDDYLNKELRKIKLKGMDQYIIERANNKDKIKPIWDRGGGATVEMWERWFDKL
ncbi:AHH domain-containing protein [Paenibacillus wenxiniae]|uniref:AHH domain-containing protein n=1 Tax=Paenibacillus wenxiniae TaxID=1636843 RepID=A0ABW4RGC3_9BACL